MYAKKTNSVKLVALVLVLALLIGGAIGGTLAWLITETDPVVNTFTVGNINITLTEEGATENAQSFKMVPGTTIEKKPIVTVVEGSESCWLFVKVEAENATGFINYTIADGWVSVDTNVYGRKVEANADTKTFSILKDDQVNVPDTVTKAMMEALTDATAPKLTFTAYAIQSDNLKKDNADVNTAEDAWAVYNDPPQQSINP